MVSALRTGVREAVGLDHDDTTKPLVVWMWRAATTEQLHGINAAVEVTGRSNADNVRRPGRSS